MTSCVVDIYSLVTSVPVYEVIFSAANSCIPHQLRYVNAVRRIARYGTVQVRKVYNLEVEVFRFVVYADSYGPISLQCLW